MLELIPVSSSDSKRLSIQYAHASGCLRPFSQREVCGLVSPDEYDLLPLRRVVEPITIGIQEFYCYREVLQGRDGTIIDPQTYWEYQSNYLDAHAVLFGKQFNLRVETAHLERDVFVSSHDKRFMITAERNLGQLTERLRVGLSFSGAFLYFNYHQQDNDKDGDHAQDVAWVRSDRILLALGHCIDVQTHRAVEKWNDIVCGIDLVGDGITRSVRNKKRSDAEPVFIEKNVPCGEFETIWQGKSNYPSSRFYNGATLEIENGFLVARGADVNWRFQVPPFSAALPIWNEPYNANNLSTSLVNALQSFETLISEFVDLDDSGVVIGKK